MKIRCTPCGGSGKILIEAKLYTSRGMEPQPPVEISCIWCNGTGKLTDEQQREIADYQAGWCTCGNPSKQVNSWRLTDGSHGYDCADCGKLLQTG